jgi:endonuclease-8
MPEGDTIRRAAERMGALLLGRVPEEILTPHPRHRMDRWPQALAGRAVRAVDAHGKHLFVRFEGDLTLHSHLRMSGLWFVCREGARWRRAPWHAWLVVRIDGWEIVQFDGPVLELLSDRRARTDPRLLSLGQDVLGADFDRARFLTALRRGDPARRVGEALLDQRVVAGIGNVWKSELCFATGIDPWRALGELEDEEALALIDLARELMPHSVSEGRRARPQAVYRRGGRPCPRCGAPIRQRGQGETNRTTYWCARCQR